MLDICCGRRELRRKAPSTRDARAGSGKYDAVAVNDSGEEESGLLGDQSGDESPPKIGSRIPVARSIGKMHLSNESVTGAPLQTCEGEDDAVVDPGDGEGRVLELVGLKVLEVPKELFDSATLVFEVVETPPGSDERVTYRSWEQCTVDVRQSRHLDDFKFRGRLLNFPDTRSLLYLLF